MRPTRSTALAAFTSASERATLQALPLDMRCAAFFAYWTWKEASLKAIGTGRSQSLSRVAIDVRPDGSTVLGVDAGRRWAVHALAPGRGYAGAVVVEGHAWRLRCWQSPAHMDGY